MTEKAIGKRLLSILLVLVLILCVMAALTLKVSGAGGNAQPVGGTAMLSQRQATWIFQKSGTDYKLKNAETGLYLALRNNTAGGYTLSLEPDNGTADLNQLFNFLRVYDNPGRYAIVVYNRPTNQCLYAAADDSGFLFHSASSWTNLPGGVANSRAQFWASIPAYPPADGDITTLQTAGGGVYLQSDLKREDVAYPVVAGAEDKGAVSEWLFTLVSGTEGQADARYSVRNVMTGLALTSQKDDAMVVEAAQMVYTGTAAQKWAFRDWYGRTIFKSDNGTTLYYENGKVVTGNWSDNHFNNSAYCYFNNGGMKPRNGVSMALLLTDSKNYVSSGFGGFDDVPFEPPVSYDVEVASGVSLTADAETWKLELDTTQGTVSYYKLKNKETGLYLTLNSVAGAPRLYQSAATASARQSWSFKMFEGRAIMVNAASNMVIYCRKGELMLQDSNNWSVSPDSTLFPSASCAQMNITWGAAAADGAETTFTVAYTGEKIRSTVLKSDLTQTETYAAEVGKGDPVSAEAEQWKLHKIPSQKPVFLLQNMDTDLYLTLRNDPTGVKLIQTERTGAANQQWELRHYQSYFILVNIATAKCLYVLNGQLGLQAESQWHIAPDGFSSNGNCQFKLSGANAAADLVDGLVTTMAVNSGNEKLRSAVTLQPPETIAEYGAEIRSGNGVSPDAARWVLDDAAGTNTYRLRNAETGLYLMLDTPAGGAPRLFQTVYQATAKQEWKLIRFSGGAGVYFMLCNVAVGKVIYAAAGTLGLQDEGNWWTAPAGFASSNHCQFNIGYSEYPPVGAEVTFLINTSEKLCSTALKTDVASYPLSGTTGFMDEIADNLYWKAEAGQDGFKLVNKMTGLYLTRLNDKKAGLRAADGSDSQLWNTKAATGGVWLQSKAGGTLSIGADGAVQLLAEAVSSTMVFETVTLTAGTAITLKNLGGMYLVNGFPGFHEPQVPGSDHPVTADPEYNAKRPVHDWVLEDTGYGKDGARYYYIHGAASGMVLSVNGSGTVVERKKDGRYNQMFLFVSTDGGYFIRTADGAKEISFEENGDIKAVTAGSGFDSKLALKGAPADGLGTYIRSSVDVRYLQTGFWDVNWVDTEFTVAGHQIGSAAKQEWVFEKVDASINTYRLRNTYNDMYMTLQGSVLFQDALRAGAAGNDQIFRLVRQNYWNGVNYYMLLSAHGKQLYIPSGTGSRAPVSMFDIRNWDKAGGNWDSSWKSANEYLWRLSAGNEAAGYPADGLTAVLTAAGGYKLEGEGPDIAERYVVGSKAEVNHDSQRWNLFSIGANYAIQNVQTGQFLTVNSNDRFVQSDFTGAANQQWAVKYDVTNKVYRFVSASTGKWFGVEAMATADTVKFASFDANVLTDNTGWRLFSVKNGVKTELTDGAMLENYGTYELMVKEPQYYLKGELTGSVPHPVTVRITSPETNNAHTASAESKIKMQAIVTPPGLSDQVVWSIRSDTTGEHAEIDDYEEFDADAGQYFGMLYLKNTGTVVIRASLKSNPEIYGEWTFEVYPYFVALINKLGECNQLQDGLYTQESYDKLAALMEQAGRVIARGDEMSQSEVNEMIRRLDEGIAALKPNLGGGYRKEIVVNLTEPTVIPSEVFRQAKDNDRIRVYNILNAKGDILYSWRFSFDENANPNYNVHLGLSPDSDNSQFIELFTNNGERMSLNLSHREPMPGNTSMSVAVGGKFADGDLLALYYFNPITQSGNLIQKDVLVENGRINLALNSGAEYFVLRTGRVTTENPPDDPAPVTGGDTDPPGEDPQDDPVPGPEEIPDTMALELTDAVVEAATAAATGSVVSIRINRPGTLTAAMMNIVKNAGKTLKIEIANDHGDVYLIWSFEDLNNITDDVELALNDQSAYDADIRGLSEAELMQIVSFRNKGALPGKTRVILRNGSGFTAGNNLTLSWFDPQTGKLTRLPDGAVVSNDNQFVAFELTGASEYLIERFRDEAANPKSPGKQTLSPVTIGIIIAVAVIMAGGGGVLAVVLVRKRRKTADIKED